MGYYRGVPHDKPQTPHGVRKRRLLDKVAAKMREYYLTHGQGCRTRAKVIAARVAKEAK